MNENEKLIDAATVFSDGKKRLRCARAAELSKQHNISPKGIGEVCNRPGIKITACRLGCFN
jgi:hypothetical protein